MEIQGASMDMVMQFTLASDCKKHYHWQCNCGLHNLAGQSSSSSSSSPAKVVSANKKKNITANDGPLSMKSRRSRSLMDLSCGGIKDKRQASLGNLLELLDPTKSVEEIRRDAAKQEPL